MITKQQLLDACRHETRVIKHVATKIPEGQLDWRPTPGQRSMGELMSYVTVMAEMMAVNAVTGNWDHAPALSEESVKVTPETFAEAMDRQMNRVAEVLGDIDDNASTTKPATLPWREPVEQSALLMRGVYASFVAYRMQLFLYAKQSGAADLATADCWAGASAPLG